MTLWWVGPFFCQQIVTMWARSWAQPTVKHKNFIQRSAAFYDFKRFRMRSEGPGRGGERRKWTDDEFLDQLSNNMTCWVIFFILYDIYILPIWHIWDFLKLQSSDALPAPLSISYPILFHRNFPLFFSQLPRIFFILNLMSISERWCDTENILEQSSLLLV